MRCIRSCGDLIIATCSVWPTVVDSEKPLQIVRALSFQTQNQSLLNDPDYIGLYQRRVSGDEYYALVDGAALTFSLECSRYSRHSAFYPLRARIAEFMAAIKNRWPNALIQFEARLTAYVVMQPIVIASAVRPLSSGL